MKDADAVPSRISVPAPYVLFACPASAVGFKSDSGTAPFWTLNALGHSFLAISREGAVTVPLLRDTILALDTGS